MWIVILLLFTPFLMAIVMKSRKKADTQRQIAEKYALPEDWTALWDANILRHESGWWFWRTPEEEKYNANALNVAYRYFGQGARYVLYWWEPKRKWAMVWLEPFECMPSGWIPDSDKFLEWEQVQNILDPTKETYEQTFVKDRTKLHYGF